MSSEDQQAGREPCETSLAGWNLNCENFPKVSINFVSFMGLASLIITIPELEIWQRRTSMPQKALWRV
jgi:hypothetical protein